MPTKEQRREYQKRYREKYPERIRESKRKSQHKHQEKRNRERREYRLANREKLKALKLKWEAENPEAVAMMRIRKRIKEMNLALDRTYRYHYAVTLANYNAILTHQKNVCAICRNPPSINKRSKRLFVDHDHKTGMLRGLLCHACNAAIGYLRENPALMLRAAEYVRAFNGPQDADWVARVRSMLTRLSGDTEGVTDRGNNQRTAAAD